MEELGNQPYGMDNIREDIASLKEDVCSLNEEVKKLIKILQGSDDKEEPDGLIHIVFMNTSLRKVLIAWLWILTGSIITIGSQVFFNLITKIAG